MDPEDEPEVSCESDLASSSTESAQNPFGHGWALISAHNPFYLLSAACVLHGSARWMQSAGGYDSVPLIALVSGYVLMMALTAIIIVRAGGVWEDARSILLLVPVLFVELALTLDHTLVTNRRLGPASAAGGFLFALCITEGLLWGLRIRLKALFRLPLHGLLAILFLYPLVIVPAIAVGEVTVASWRIFLFSPAVAVVLLTLLPAVRRGPDAVRENGTPWSWPWFPWTLFGVLIACLCVRGYALSLSFDPVLSLNFDAAMQLSSAWGPYFLVPILFAVAVLVLEEGVRSGKRSVQGIALTLPAVCVLLASPSGPTSGPHAEFLAELTQRVGSPLVMTLIGSAVFYAVAWGRRVTSAEPALVGSLLLLTLAFPATLGPFTLSDPRPLGMLVVASLLLATGIWKRDSRRSLLAALLGIGAAVLGPLAAGPEWVQGFVSIQLTVLSIFLVGRLLNDAFARRLRPLGAWGLLSGVVTSLVALLGPPASVPEWTVPTYLILMIALAFAAAYPLGSLLYFWVGVSSLALSSTELFRRAFLHWEDTLHGEALGSFLLAFALFLVAAGISALKAGLGRRLIVLLPSQRQESWPERD